MSWKPMIKLNNKIFHFRVLVW